MCSGKELIFGGLEGPKEERWKIAVGGLRRLLADGSGEFAVAVGDGHHAAVRRIVKVERRAGIHRAERPERIEAPSATKEAVTVKMSDIVLDELHKSDKSSAAGQRLPAL